MDYYNVEVEVWKEVLEFQAYEVSNLGNIRTRIRQKRHGYLIVPRDDPYRRSIAITPTKKGRLQAQLWRLDANGQLEKPDGKPKKYAKTVHQLVATAFICPRPVGMVCRHWDGNPKNNRADNLCWGTPSDNERDKIRHGTYQFGEKNPYAKLTPADILEIDRMGRLGIVHSRIAPMFNITRRHVGRIINRERWQHLVSSQ